MAQDTAARLGRLLGIGPIRLFDSAAQLRDHDLLVRAQAAQRLGAAANAVRDLAARYRLERIPPATREAPFPPAERMAALRGLEERTQRLQDIAARVRSAQLPAQDLVWERLRTAMVEYELLLEGDLALLAPCQRCLEAALALTLDAADRAGGLDDLDRTQSEAERALTARSALLSAS